MATLFEKIIAREIPAAIVYEDEHTVAFLDIHPIHQGHTLVVPKKSYENIFDMDTDTLVHLTRTAHIVAQALYTTVHCDGVNLHMNNGSAAGQEIPHAHIHIIPRFHGDTAFVCPEHESYNDTEAETLAIRLAASIKKSLQ